MIRQSLSDKFVLTSLKPFSPKFCRFAGRLILLSADWPKITFSCFDWLRLDKSFAWDILGNMESTDVYHLCEKNQFGWNGPNRVVIPVIWVGMTKDEYF